MGFFSRNEKVHEDGSSDENVATNEVGYGEITDNVDHLQRRLANRQIQLIAIGGSIGTALFVSIGGGLNRGGPASLFIAYTLYSFIMAAVNNCIAEMSILHPVSGGFVRLAGKWVDEALGFTAGWNFFFYEALLIPFEITALNVVLSYWRDDIPAAAVCSVAIVLYGLINVLAVGAYGEAEFWLSGGKFFLICILFMFTFITMVGGNPQGDAYGFRYWNSPGAFAEHLSSGGLGRFEGFLACLWSAAFTIVGPEYISMVAAEAMRPRTYIKTAFKTVYWRFGIFFIVGALCTGIVIPYNDPQLVRVLTGGDGGGTAAASPYVIAMSNLGITILPDFVNALLVTSIFSAGNTYTYAGTRTLYGLALDGRAPKILTRTTKKGVPILCFICTIAFAFLSFLSLSSDADIVLQWLVDLITAGGIIDYIIMTWTFIAFYNACKAQGVDRRTFPYYGRFQPYCAYIALVFEILVCLFFGYSSFREPTSGNAELQAFWQNYALVVLAPILFFGWKIIHRTKFVKKEELDLVWERPIVDQYEASFLTPPTGFWEEMGQLIGIKRKNADGEKARRRSSVVPMDQGTFANDGQPMYEKY